MKSYGPVLAIAVLVVVAAFVFVYDNGSKTTVPAQPSVGTPAQDGGVGQTLQPLSSPVPAGDKGQGAQSAPMLGDLVGRLEAKVKAEPDNVDNQILLAQTYSELGRTDDGVAILRTLSKAERATPRVYVVLASLLSKSGQPQDLKEATQLLDKAEKQDPAQTGFVRLYRGRILVAQGDKDAAVKVWQDALKKVDPNDGARGQIEQELSRSTQSP
jgi:cytochrome c-type biogenesis protein CcmH/NrfG